MFCHVCGREVNPETQFCPTCGQPLGTAPAGGGAAAWTPPTQIESHTSRWIGRGWEIVRADLGMYLVITLIVLVLTGMVPLILQGALMAGFHIYCMKRMMGRRAELADLFAGFNFFVPTLAASLVTAVFVSVGLIFCIIPGLVLTAMYVFTYLFIMDKRMDFWPAMQASHAVVRNDYVGFTLFIVVLGLLNLLGLLLCVVGLFLTIPITVAAITAAYGEVIGFEPGSLDRRP